MEELIGTRHGDFHLRLDGESASRGNTRSAGNQKDCLWHMFGCVQPAPAGEAREKRDQELKTIASEMAWESEPTDPSSDSQIPAGYTILGQFITHDLTFNTRPLDAGTVDDTPKGGGDRTPQLDLDSVYEQSPRLAYKPPREEKRPERMLYRRERGLPDDLPRYADVGKPNDLTVYPGDKAIIGDVRNDDNILLSQLHLAFLKLHNQFVGYFRRKGEADNKLFACARKYTVWHYQWVIVNDYLPRIVGQEVIDCIVALDDKTRRPTKSDFKLYTPPGGTPPQVGTRPPVGMSSPIPVEFSAAAFRFGHSMIRSLYRVNKAGIEYPLFGASKYDPRHLGGQRRLPAMLEVDWTRFFFESSPLAETTDEASGVPATVPSVALPAEASEARERAEARLRRLQAEAEEARKQAIEAREKADEAREVAEKAKAGTDAGDTTAEDEAVEARIRAHEAERQAAAAAARAKAAEANLKADDAEAKAKGAEARAKAVNAGARAAAAGTQVGVAAATARKSAVAARKKADEAATAQAIAELELFSKVPGVFARKIDSHLTQILSSVPEDILPPDDRLSTKSLALRDLERGDRLGLKSGPAVARMVLEKVGEEALGKDFEILLHERLGLDKLGLGDVDVPLWFYLLKEAELLGNGERLGPVGGRIVAEVILGVLLCDEESYFHNKKFEPVPECRAADGELKMNDLLRYARALSPDGD